MLAAARAVNRPLFPDAQPWVAWHHALVEKVVQENYIHRQYVQDIEDLPSGLHIRVSW